MIIHDFINSLDDAREDVRIRAASGLAELWCSGPMSAADRRAAAAAMTLILDDRSSQVRAALAAGIAAREDMPRNIVLALAGDVEAAAVPIVSSSPLLSDLDLIDCLAHPSAKVAQATAERQTVSPALAAAIAEVAPAEAVLALLTNPGAALLPGTLARLTERFGRDAAVRNELLHLDQLPVALRHKLLQFHAETLVDHPLVLPHVQDEEEEREFLAEASDKIALKLAEACDDDGLAELVDHLRISGQLTTRLLLRSVCCGQNRFFVRAMSVLTGMPDHRLAQTLASGRSASLRAVLRKAGLALRSHQAFVLAIEMARGGTGGFTRDLDLERTRSLTEQVLSELQDDGFAAESDVLSFLRRFAADLARQEARLVLGRARQPALHAAA